MPLYSCDMRPPLPGERAGFYERTLLDLLGRGVLRRDMRLLVVAAGETDARVLAGLGFTDVTLTNLDPDPSGDDSPFVWEHQDAEALSYPDGAFEFALVSAGLHHCSSPHRALLELYRVVSGGLLALESRDSLLMRAAVALGLADEYEVTAVVAHRLRAGGVRNSSLPNYVYRWTEREVAKTIASHAPHARHRLLFFRELEAPASVLDMRVNPLWGRALRLLEPAAALLTRLVPSQSNLFAFAVLKPELPRELQPWLELVDGVPEPDEAWIRARYSLPGS